MYLVRPSYLIKKLFPKAYWRGNSSQKKIYLTLDDGPVPEATPFVLDLLQEKSIRATFFCVGNNVVKNPELYQRILNENHVAGNHTFNHLNGWNTETEEYIKNIRQCDEVLRQGTSMSNTPLFRPPYGKLKRSQSRQLRKHYSVVMWDVLSGDYDPATTPEKCLENVISNVRNGSVIVFHDSKKAKANMEYALPRFIDWALGQGYVFDVLK
jgi:peptidoglycan/xylan/chitin deacetylase (PgdA/CDA1 family)